MLTNENCILVFQGYVASSQNKEFCAYGLQSQDGFTVNTNNVPFATITQYIDLTTEEMYRLDHALHVLHENGCFSYDILYIGNNSLIDSLAPKTEKAINDLNDLGYKLFNISIKINCADESNSKSKLCMFPISGLFNHIKRMTSKITNAIPTPFYKIQPEIENILEKISSVLKPLSENNVEPATQFLKHVDALLKQEITPDHFLFLSRRTLKESQKKGLASDSIVNACMFVIQSVLGLFDNLSALICNTQTKNSDITRRPFFANQPRQEIERKYKQALDQLETLMAVHSPKQS